jgi:hypothetical protein
LKNNQLVETMTCPACNAPTIPVIVHGLETLYRQGAIMIMRYIKRHDAEHCPACGKTLIERIE